MANVLDILCSWEHFWKTHRDASIKMSKGQVFQDLQEFPCRPGPPHHPIPFLDFYTHFTFSLSTILKAVSIHTKLTLPASSLSPTFKPRRFPSWTPLEMLSSSSHYPSVHYLLLIIPNAAASHPPPPGSFQALSASRKHSPPTAVSTSHTEISHELHFVTCLLWLSWTVTKICSFKKTKQNMCVLFSPEYCEGFGRRGWALSFLVIHMAQGLGTQ